MLRLYGCTVKEQGEDGLLREVQAAEEGLEARV
jgi:hypothetical protein